MQEAESKQGNTRDSASDAQIHGADLPDSSTPNRQTKRGWFGHCRHNLNRLVLLLLIIVTVYLSAGRLLMPLAATQTDWLQARLVESLGVEISVGRMQGSWSGFSPILELYDLEILTEQEAGTTHSLQELHVGLNIPQSLWRRQLIIDRIIVDNMSLLIQEDADGNWSLAGFQSAESGNPNQLLNLLFNTSRLQLSEAGILLQHANGMTTNLGNIYLDIQNRLQDHQAQLQFRVNRQASPIEMAVTLRGDPMARYTAEAYLDFSELELAPLLAETFSQSLTLNSFNSSGQLWMEFDNQSIKQIQGSLQDLDLIANLTDGGQALELTSGSVDITAIQPIPSQWSVWAQNLQFDLSNRPWESGDFFIQVEAKNQGTAVELQGESIDLAILGDVLEVIDLPAPARAALDDLNPRGMLRNLHLQTDFSGSYPGGFALRANLDEVSVDAWNAAPSGAGISGYVQADRDSGFVEVDSSDFSIQLPRLFEDSWHYNDINGRVYWTVNDGQIRVHSEVIDARNQNLHGHVQFELRNRALVEGGWDTDFTLLIGVLDFDAANKSLYLPTLSNISGTMDWLDTAVVGGRVSNSGLLFRGKTSNVTNPLQRNVQTFYYAEDASLRFLPDWPLLENADAFISVDNNRVDVSTSAATIGGLELGAGTAGIRPLTDSRGAWLSVAVDTVSAGNAGLDFLRETPIRDLTGDSLDGWELEGSVDLSVDLGIPLNNPGLGNDIRVVVQANNNTLHIPDLDLDFNGIHGAVNYTSAEGLSAPGLSSDFMGYPLATRISTTDTGIVINSNGRASGDSLQAWSLQPVFVRDLLGFAEGEFSYAATLSIFNQAQPGNIRSSLSLRSDLLGLRLNLPQPLDKARDENGMLNLDFSFNESLEHVALDFRDQLSADLRVTPQGVQGGVVNFGGNNESFQVRQLNNEPGLLVSGAISDFDLAAWQQVAGSFSSEQENAAGIIRLVDVNIGNLKAFNIDLQAINTVLQRETESWKLSLENARIKGDLIFHDDTDLPLDVSLSYLRLPGDEEDEPGDDAANPEASPDSAAAGSDEAGIDAAGIKEEEIDVLAAVNPALLPDINFRTEEFSRGEGNLGAWEFTLRARPDGATISNLSMRSAEAAISDRTGESGASMEWVYQDGQHHSSFDGLFSAGDLAEVLPDFGYGAVVQSESARFDSNLTWTGSPAFFALKRSTGQVDMELQSGSFMSIDSGSARLFGAFNFDTLVRRLQLDFSDLYERGLAFDSITGLLDFDNGIVTTSDNFLIRGPSSTINVNGQLDLVNETIQADVLVNLPLGQNVSMVAGILGAWPIALGTYVASIIFRDQLDNFTTILYRLDGPWDAPQAGFASDNQAVEQAMEEVGVLENEADMPQNGDD